MMNDDDGLIRRAIAAWYRSGGEQEPVTALSSVETVSGGQRYIMLRTTTKLLAVYRVKPDGALRRLRRLVAELKYIEAERHAAPVVEVES